MGSKSLEFSLVRNKVQCLYDIRLLRMIYTFIKWFNFSPQNNNTYIAHLRLSTRLCPFISWICLMFDTHEYVLCIYILIFLSVLHFVLFAWFAVVTLVKNYNKTNSLALVTWYRCRKYLIIVWELLVFVIFIWIFEVDLLFLCWILMIFNRFYLLLVPYYLMSHFVGYWLMSISLI